MTERDDAPRAVCIIRSSQGADDKVSLDMQREQVPARARELVGDDGIVERIDLGIHTGFSTFSRDEDGERIDEHPDIQQLVDDIEAGVYDYLVAWDDTRIARDDYFFVVQYAALRGGCDIELVEAMDLDSIEFRVGRIVEQWVKEREMAKARAAWEQRVEEGAHNGRAKYGTEYDDDGRYMVPVDGFDDALEALRLRDEEGASYRDIISETGIGSTSTVRRVLEQREFYVELAREHGIEVPDGVEAAAGGD